jgi:hypothetical protein
MLVALWNAVKALGAWLYADLEKIDPETREELKTY